VGTAHYSVRERTSAVCSHICRGSYGQWFVQLFHRSNRYVFDDQLGSLDDVLASADLALQVTSAKDWNINSDEILVFDYYDGILTSDKPSFERESDAQMIYTADFHRSSDHDPVLLVLASFPLC
jgi:predicted extracellular nuclease